MLLRRRCQRFYFRQSSAFSKRPKLARALKIFALITFAFLLFNLINGILFSTILLFQENEHEPDYDFDTRPHYKMIEMKKRFDQSGNYLIVEQFLQYRTNLTKNADLLSLILHCDIAKLHLLLEHANVWDGPISLALYVKGTRGSDDIDYASIWFRCHRKLFKMLDVHLVISGNAYQSSISNQHHSHRVKYAVHCQQLNYINNTDGSDTTPYPSNLLRNVARDGITVTNVQFILNLDIDIFPSSDLFHHLITFYSQTKVDESFNRTLYVIPTFEIQNETMRRSLPVPRNKRELVLLWNDKQIQPYESEICAMCQSATNYNAWIQETKDEKVLTLFRPHYSQPWKPYFVGPKQIPTFDPRFKAHAHARISQCCESFLSGYDYAVLNNVYLYRIGFLDRSQSNPTDSIDDPSSLLLFQQFHEDLLKKYPNSTRTC